MASRVHPLAPMRGLATLFVLVVLAGTAAASPKVAVVLIEGDASNGQLTGVVAEEAAKHATVLDSDLVERAEHSLAIDGVPEGRDLKKLRARLKADVVVTGKVAKSGGKLKLALTVTGRTGKAESFAILFTKSSAKPFRTELANALKKHVAGVDAAATDGDDDDEDDRPRKPPPPKDDEADARVARRDKEKEREREREREKDKQHDKDKDDEGNRRKHVAAKDRDKDPDDGDGGDEDGAKIRKRRRRSREVDRNPVTQAAIFLDGGAAGLRRTLTYSATPTGTPPPKVGTAGATAQVEAAYYFGESTTGFGLVGTLRQTVGLAITVPGTTLSCPITEALYTVGARYRIPIGGESSLAFGASYWRYRYLANRKKLGASPGMLDMPDVDYSAIAPGAELKYALSRKSALFASLLIPVVASSGPVTTTFGGKGSFGFAFDGGLDIALAPHYGVRFEAILDQIGVTFDQTNTVAMTRGLTSATDRTMGLVATFAMIY